MTRPSLDLLHRGSSDEFVDSLIHEIQVHPALNHAYLINLSKGNYSLMDETLRDYAHQYSFYSSWFVRYLNGVISALPLQEHKDLLMENLREEVGNPLSNKLSDKPHVEIFESFKESIGIDSSYTINHPPSTTTILWRDLFMQKCSSKVLGVGLGAIGLATEFIVPSIYKYIAEAIENHSSFGSGSSLFFRLHIDCDDDHSQTLVDITREMAYDFSNREAIRFGVISALNLRAAFWDSQLARITLFS